VDNRAIIALPAKDAAPAFRESVRDLAHWRMEELADGFAAVEPEEGAGALHRYFRIRKLCDASTPLTEDTWAPLLERPALTLDHLATPRTRPDGPPDPQWRQRLMDKANSLEERPGADLAAVSMALLALQPSDAPAYLQRQVPELFSSHPDGSLWFVDVDPLLSRRLSLLRILLAFDQLPDYEDVLRGSGGEHPGIRTLQEHSLTRAFQFSALYEPVLLSIPPASMGFVFPWSPQALVFLFGYAASLMESPPPTLASLFAPEVQRAQFGWHWNAKFFEGLAPGEIEALLQWWISRLNVVYSFIADPTRFVDPVTRRLRPTKPIAWYLTFERMLADFLSIASMPQGPPLARLETAFDLLDKAEALLGYGSDDSGKGFQQLLRRRDMVPRMEAIWNRVLPVQLRSRFCDQTRRLYDSVYQGIEESAYPFRRYSGGVEVWSSKTNRLEKWTWDDYVPRLVRAVRTRRMA
jgi:hypothetical protein